MSKVVSLPDKRQMREAAATLRRLSRQLDRMERDHAEYKDPQKRVERLRNAALERSIAAQQRFKPFVHLFREHLREAVFWIAVGSAAGTDDGTVVEQMLSAYIAIALGDESWRTLISETAAAVKDLDK